MIDVPTVQVPVPVQRLDAEGAREQIEALIDLLIDCVEGGASVGFMLPFDRVRAGAFWRRVIDSVETSERSLFVARDAAGRVVGSVQLVLAQMENQPHRAEVSKLLVHRAARNRGVGEALMAQVERHADEIGKTVLVLDTANPAAERLYRRRGWQLTGQIPGYALMPGGEPCATTIFYKFTSRAP